jgi:uncharacterized membrane protein
MLVKVILTQRENMSGFKMGSPLGEYWGNLVGALYYPELGDFVG